MHHTLTCLLRRRSIKMNEVCPRLRDVDQGKRARRGAMPCKLQPYPTGGLHKDNHIHG